MEDNRLEMTRELEEMRQQFAVLKGRFERQEIITDRLLKETQKRRINVHDWLNLYIPAVALAISIPFLVLCTISYGLPLWSCIVVALGAVIAFVWQYNERMKYKKEFRFESDVQRIASCVRNYRRRTLAGTIIEAIIMTMVFIPTLVSWFGYIEDSSTLYLSDDPVKWLFVAVIWIILFGGMIWIEVKRMRLLDNIIKDLEQ